MPPLLTDVEVGEDRVDKVCGKLPGPQDQDGGVRDLPSAYPVVQAPVRP